MTRISFRAGIAALAVAGAAWIVSAQGHPGPGGFGRGPWMGQMGPGAGSFEFGGLVGGFGGRVITGKPMLATFTITRNEPLAGGGSISSTTTGTLARGLDGSTYRDVKLPAIGPWAAAGKMPEFSYIRNVSTSTQYIVNVTKGTYEAFPVHEHTPPEGGPGQAKRPDRGPGKGPNADNVAVTDNPNGTYTDGNTVYSSVDDRKTKRTIPTGAIGNTEPITITSERWYSAALGLVLEETHSDPRFGTSTYQLSGIVPGPPSASLFVPNPAFTQSQGKGFGKRGFRGPGGNPPPPPGD